MSLVERIKSDFMTAYKEKNFAKKNSLALVKAEILLIEKKRECTDKDVYAILTILLNWIKETLKVTSSEEILSEKNLYESYFPTELSRDEINTILTSNFQKPYDIRTVMSYFEENYWRAVNKKTLSELIKE